MRVLLDKQLRAIEKLQRLKVGALFMACGTGKTQTAVELINSVDDVDLLLWICPCQIKANTEAELAICDLKYTPDIVGVESIGCSDRIFMALLEKVKQHKRVFVIIDESIKIKNIKAKRTKKLLQISEHCQYKLILNGTPVTKNILDIYAQMTFLSDKILGCNFYRFRDQFCKYWEKKDAYGRTIGTHVYGYANVDYLLSVIDPYIYQCEMNLPLEKRYYEYEWKQSEEEGEDYYRLKEALFDAYESGEDEHLLGILSKLQHSYCCNESKFGFIEKLIDDKTLIYCKFIRSKIELEKRFPGAMVLTYGKNSFGLNLQKYNRIIYFDKTFDYAFREQSEARIYREGQESNCEYFDLTGEIGLEKMISKCIFKKESLIKHFKEKCKSNKELL